jgi:hypothetical protein
MAEADAERREEDGAEDLQAPAAARAQPHLRVCCSRSPDSEAEVAVLELDQRWGRDSAGAGDTGQPSLVRVFFFFFFCWKVCEECTAAGSAVDMFCTLARDEIITGSHELVSSSEISCPLIRS